MSRSDPIGSYSERTTCPRCGDRIKLEDVRVFVKPNDPYPKCPTCGTSIRVSIVYQRLIMLITFALGWLIPYLLGLRAYVVVAWVPFWLLTSALAPNIAKVMVPPKLEDAHSVTHRSALRRNVELFMLLWLYFVLVILLNVVIQGAMEDRRAYLSGPLAWLEPAFVAGTETTFVGISEIVLANSFIGAVCFFPLTIMFWAAFQAAFRRSHIKQLGISRSVQGQGEDDDET